MTDETLDSAMLYEQGRLQGIDTIIQVQGFETDQVFYRKIQEWPAKNPSKIIESIQVIDSQSCFRKAIILHRKKV